MKLILMPGLDGTGTMFKPLLSALGPDITTQIIAYPSDRHLTLDELCSYARDQLEQIDDQFVLLAESFSGPIALRLLQTPLPNIRGAIFVATFCRAPRPFLAPLAKILPLEHIVRLAIPELFLKLFCFGSDIPPETIVLLKNTIALSDTRVLSKRLLEICSLKPPEFTLRKFPSCYIQAQHDRLVPNSCFKSFQKLAPHIQLVTVKGPHFLLQAKPNECKGIIERFINSMITHDGSDFQ